jgi:NCAIR mutase (PurE)-related protein
MINTISILSNIFIIHYQFIFKLKNIIIILVLKLELEEIIKALKEGNISEEEAIKRIRLLAVKELENLCLDISRGIRKKIPEIILAEGKTDEDLLNAIKNFINEKGYAIVSRIYPQQVELVKNNIKAKRINYYEKGRVLALRMGDPKPLRDPPIAVITAGSADIYVAEEARAIINELGFKTITFYDVGIAGLQRIFPVVRRCMEEGVEVAIVIAGMEGALPSVFSSLFYGIVIGVPTSIGYGYGGGGIGALMTMLQSCSPGVLVVNIDNGVGAAIAAVMISSLASKNKV